MLAGPVIRHIALLVLLVVAAAACYAVGFRTGFGPFVALGAAVEVASLVGLRSNALSHQRPDQLFG